jgi:hypothetical protein
MRLLRLFLILSVLLPLAVPAQARRLGPTAAKNMLGTAAVGSLIGLCAGAEAYGLSNNTAPSLLLMDTVYGFVGGAVLGTGLTVAEFSLPQENLTGTVCRYAAGGAGIGMLMGVVVALIPYAQKELHNRQDCENFNEGAIGLGLGGLIGGGMGLSVAVVDLSFRSGEDAAGRPAEKTATGSLGLQPEDGLFPPVNPGEARSPALWCRVVSVTF